MSRTSRPRRAAAGAGAAIVLAAGAATGVVLADLERTLPASAAEGPTSVLEQAPALAATPDSSAPPSAGSATPAPSGPALRSAPAPQNPSAPGIRPDASTRAS